MSISKFVVVAMLSFCALGSLSATSSAKHPKKHYLNEKSINVTKEGIIVSTKKGDLKLSALRSNQKGFYIYQQDICRKAAKGFDDPDYWARCPHCGQWFDTPWDEMHHKCKKKR